MVAKLAELERKRPNDNSLYRARFGVFFEWLRNRGDDDAFDAIRDPVRAFIFETHPVPKGALVLGVENPKRQFHTHRTLSRERQLNFMRTGHALLKRGFVRRNENNQFELLRYIPSSVADEVAQELNSVFTISATAKKTWIAPRNARQTFGKQTHPATFQASRRCSRVPQQRDLALCNISYNGLGPVFWEQARKKWC